MTLYLGEKEEKPTGLSRYGMLQNQKTKKDGVHIEVWLTEVLEEILNDIAEDNPLC